MKSIPNLSLALCLLTLALLPGLAATETTAEAPPTVRAVLLFDSASPQSQQLFAFFLPALFERYGARLQVSGIDLAGPEGAGAYSALAERLDLPPEPGEEPVVVVGERVIVGVMEIAKTLGDDFEQLIEEPGARNWPPAEAISALLPRGIEDIKSRVAAQAALAAGDVPGEASPKESDRLHAIANGLAILVLIGMIVTVVLSMLRLRRKDAATGPAVLTSLVLTLLVGLGISGYTAYTALFQVELMCGPVSGCAAVQESEYSKLFGIPMGVLGLFGYTLILLTFVAARVLSPAGGGWNWLPWTVALLGVLFSIRLTALEPFVIGATCLWCLGSAVTITAALWLLSGFTSEPAEIERLAS